jgi:hypothetical protein
MEPGRDPRRSFCDITARRPLVVDRRQDSNMPQEVIDIADRNKEKANNYNVQVTFTSEKLEP